jgi:hypothetical protein
MHRRTSPLGWLMGGQREYLEKVSSLYEYILNKTLELGTICVVPSPFTPLQVECGGPDCVCLFLFSSESAP